MKILVVSDSHGYEGNINQVVKKEGPFDMLLHLGDYESGEARIRKIAGDGCRVELVPGNNDFDPRQPSDKILHVKGHKILMTHGHKYRIRYSINNIIFAAQEKGADIVMFGHSHMPVYESYGGITILNPGSISEPRQADKIPTYAIIDMEENGIFTISIKQFTQ